MHVKPEVAVDALNQKCQVSTTKITFFSSYKLW